MVFDAQAAPRDRAEFLAWYDQQTAWNEPHSYNDPEVLPPTLRAWFLDIIQTFPPMNGRLAADDPDNSMVTDYGLGEHVIYAAFSWSVSRQAYQQTWELAARHGVGFFDVSSTTCDLWFPTPDRQMKNIANELGRGFWSKLIRRFRQ